MAGIQDEGADPFRFRDPGIAEALPRPGPEAAAAHPGVLTRCGGTWVHHVRGGGTVGVREVSGAEPGALQARIRDFRDRMEPLPALARDSGDAESGDALEGAAPAGSAAACRAVPGAGDAELPAPGCPDRGRVMERRRRKVPKTFLARPGGVAVRRSHHHCRRRGEGRVPPGGFPGLEGTSVSPGAERMVAEPAAGVPVRKAHSLPRELSGLSAGRSCLRERAVGPGGDAVRPGREGVAPAGGERPGRIRAPVDGTGVPMRGDALEGRAGKGEDGRAGTRGAKLPRLHGMVPDPGTGRAETVPGSVTRSAATGSAAAPGHGTGRSRNASGTSAETLTGRATATVARKACPSDPGSSGEAAGRWSAGAWGKAAPDGQ